MKCAVFPGQGNQYVGMGEDIYRRSQLVKGMYEAASDITGIDVRRISFEGPKELQRETLNTQLITFVHSCALYTLLTEGTENPFEHIAGFSVGEYSALVAAGVVSFEDGIRILKKRGEIMSRCSFDEPCLVAVIGANRKELTAFCEEEAEGDLEIAIYSAPDVFVVGGLPQSIREYQDKIPCRRIVPIDMSIPAHTTHLLPHFGEFLRYLGEFELTLPEVALYSNVSGRAYTNGDLRKGLAELFAQPVLWSDVMNAIPAESFVEIGPGNSLAKLIKRNRKGAVVSSVQTLDDLEKLKQRL